MATTSQYGWNRGRTGKGAKGRTVDQPTRCTTDGCGAEATATTPPGMRRVAVEGSREPARVYCAGWCAAYGLALAEIRALPVRGGEA
ncbi:MULTISPECIES: hypothetical protein [Streptomycetaceae]|uniref:Uncharacterized protein n=1 Tax=Streptantibioticus cattleyicolor (strain ATCC 35852 / DSM 46488 / JCM 4925 / NBRC 14057 / NRRL 8057) TaxID=1003195 RepID=F8JY70_STREN|nr:MULTISPECIES: hypothetical protein [Streptomycetaceae]AEW94646.1 hypothetical protein SCATT_22750 [Streptantibioticus cattleyicolor NRRL 8057 = DSM 46488]MYS59284.1 hypothetical protein [Streptomyces sp. SID5468]CCB75003.1 protein of unknown function [Streptantibioticus cattleyicolor NRRL 8057 = DSM 46488]